MCHRDIIESTCVHAPTQAKHQKPFSKRSSWSGIESWRDTREQSWTVFALSLFLQATSRVHIDTLEGHAGRSWGPHHATMPGGKRALIYSPVSTLLLKKTLALSKSLKVITNSTSLPMGLLSGSPFPEQGDTIHTKDLVLQVAPSSSQLPQSI